MLITKKIYTEFGCVDIYAVKDVDFVESVYIKA